MNIGANIKRLRESKGWKQPDLARASGVSQQLVSQIERGINRSTKHLPALARALGVTVPEIDPSYSELPPETVPVEVPIISWVSAGAMQTPDAVEEVESAPRISMTGLGAGDWIALRVQGHSMDRISPPDSIIFVDRRDTRLVSNACYVIVGPDGEATYKRYRGNPARFEPVSVDADLEPVYPDHDPVVIGRVRRTVLDM